ncbi:hypothetical protein [Nostoc sp. TCL240-02]|uniref:hypothetical protein n=1 Tax=Nostoc sp. TCL240-02 TaxID=2572090 RepID=UPI00157FB6B9|nr:hypothetical protein [Nostoc sp. TCL240-02]QKQ75574.1 hypothetical protein FBB35_21825 [Nostoc sp. TCL240-02]
MIIPFQFTFETAEELYNCDEKYPVDFEIAWKLLGYSRKDSAKRKLIGYFMQDTDYRLHSNVESAPDGGLTHREDIYLTVECFKEMGMLAKSEEGKQIRKYFLQCEAIAKQSVKAIPRLQRQIQQLQENFDRLQSQVQKILPISSDFTPPGWDAEVWRELPPQDKRHFRYLYQNFNFHPESEAIDPSLISAEARLQQRQEMERIVGEVTPSETWRIDDAKQELLARFWAEGGANDE